MKNSPHWNETLFILKTLRAIAGGRQISLEEFDFSNFDWPWILTTSASHCILPFIGHYWEKQGGLPHFPPQRQKTMQVLSLYSQNMAAMRLRDFSKIAALLNQKQIPVIPLKGVALLLTVYKDMPYRFMNDIDILIRKNDLFSTEYLFRKDAYWPHSPNWCGFSSRYKWRDQLFPRDIYGSGHFNKGALELDLHWDPHYFVGNTRVSTGASEFWDRAKPSSIGPNVRELSEMDLFYFTLLHALDFHSPVLSQYLDLSILMNRYQITSTQVLEKGLPSIPSSKRPSVENFMKMLDEVFLSSSETFSDTTYKLLTDTFEIREKYLRMGKGNPPKKTSSLGYFLKLKSLKDRALFIAGYFIPNPGFYAPDTGLKMHLRHWGYFFSDLNLLKRKNG